MKPLFKMASGWWRARQRGIDRQVLWPEMLRAADGDRATALGAYQVHMILDSAYHDLDDDERKAFLRSLP